MAAAFALGAEGVQMGTRMVSAAESPVHQNWKDAILRAEETDTVFLNRFHSPALRALRTERSARLEKEPAPNALREFGSALDLYFGGDMEASIALSGQVCGRIDEREAGAPDPRRDQERVLRDARGAPAQLRPGLTPPAGRRSSRA